MDFNNLTERRNYYNVHYWVIKTYGKATKCEFCGVSDAKMYHWALKRGCVYEKNIDSFFQLCVSCHRKYDTTEATIEKYRKRMSGVLHSNDTKVKMSDAHKMVDKSYLIGRKLSDETRKKISDAKRGKPIGVGKKLSESHKAAISKAMRRRYS